MTFVETVLVGIATSLVASTVFVCLFFRLKPAIEISPYIAREDIDGETFFIFKIVNRSKRAIIDVRVEASLATQTNVEGGPIYRTHQIAFRKSYMFQMGGFNQADHGADYACRFATRENLDSMWNNDSDIVRFRVIATDHFSGFSQAFLKEFRTRRNCIVDGSHKWGADLGVS